MTPRETPPPTPRRRAGLAILFAAITATTSLHAAAPGKTVVSDAPWVEADFPFFSSILDARKAGLGLPADNLAPRGIVLNLGLGCWACFDPDLLRFTMIWQGAGVTPTALAPGSYQDISRKTPGGQTNLPRPDGRPWIATGTYPGGNEGESLSLTDPREPAPSPEEVGRGALPEELGRFNAVRTGGRRAVLEYRLGQTTVSEWLTAGREADATVITRNFELGASPKALRIVLGVKAPGTLVSLGLPMDATADSARLIDEKGVTSLLLSPRSRPLRLTVAFNHGAAVAPQVRGGEPAPSDVMQRWKGEVFTTVRSSKSNAAYVIDRIDLPVENPWRRGVRPADIQFLPDGTAVMITLDGDVWLVRGLDETSGRVTWRRFTSGLHEPMTIAIRGGEIFAFDRNGIWRLRDTNGDGEADVHEMFANGFGQTADMREFPSQIRVGPGGEFFLAKGGQQATTQGKHNGSVLRVSADGRKVTVLGRGFRQPNIGVDPVSGLVTSSDQQGNYVPSTPLFIVENGNFHGFLAPFEPVEKYPAPIADPLTWIPHPVNASALSQVWLHGANLGPLNGGLVHLGYNRPEFFRVLFNRRGKRPQAAVVSITKDIDYPPLNGAVNPADGLLYVAGFQVIGWGNVIDVTAGLGRLRRTSTPVTLPAEVAPMTDGVLLRFDVALDPRVASDPANYSLQSWSYRRTSKYGSAMYKADGAPGQDALTPSAAYVSRDARSVFVAVPGMKPVMQLRVGWSLATADGLTFHDNAYTTPYELATFNPVAEGFAPLKVDLTARAAAATVSAAPPSAAEGARLAQMFACVACHGSDNNPAVARSGPPWQGLYGSQRKVFISGKAREITADEAYLRESILEPSAKLAAGFEKGEYAMASYAGVLTETQIDSLILHIKTLR
jgi:glucose/arabinose dehydrogenase/cytochrome c553